MKICFKDECNFCRNVKQVQNNTKLAIQQHNVDYEDILTKLGFGRVQWLVFIQTGLIIFMAMNEICGIGIIALASKCDFELNSVQKGILTASSISGNILSSYFWGYLSDTVGRRPVVISSLLATNFFSAVGTFMPNYWTFAIVRFFVGLSISGSVNVSYAYLGEFFTAYYRPVVINYASLLVGISLIYVPAVAWAVLLMDWSFQITTSLIMRPWRLLAFLYTAPGLISALILWFLPESPKILQSLGRRKEANEALKSICTKNSRTDILKTLDFEKLNITGVVDKSIKTKSTNIFHKMWNETYPLFQRPLVGNFLICCFAMYSIFMTAIGMSIWFPDIQNRLRSNRNSEEGVHVCEVIASSLLKKYQNGTLTICITEISRNTYHDYISYGVMCLIGYLLLGTIINLFGRKLIYIAFLSISGICGIALLWISEPIGIFSCFAIYLILSELCMSITNGLIVDLVPTHLCGQAVCICLMLGRLGSVFATNFIGFFLESNCLATFSFFSILLIVSAALAYLLPI